MANVQKLNIRPNKELLTSLVALWEFNESSGSTAASSVGSFNATLGAGGSFATGKMGNCLVTTGATNGYAMISDNAAFDATEFTMNVWANVSGAGSQSDSFIFGTRESYTNKGCRYIEYENAGGRQYMPNIAVGDADANLAQYADTVALTVGTWYMLTMTVAADRKLRYYRNGSLISTSAAIAGTGTFNLRGYLTYGALQDHGNTCEYGMNGKVDSAGVWNRALSDAEVTALYNSTNGLPYANFTDQAWKDVTASFINIGDVWKPITGAWVNVGDVWKRIFGPAKLTDSVLHALEFNESVGTTCIDAAGKGNGSTNNSTRYAGVSAGLGNCCQIGSSTYNITYPNITLVDKDWTINLWVKPINGVLSGFTSILDVNSSLSRTIQIGTYYVSSQFYTQVTAQGVNVRSTSVMTNNAWHMITAVCHDVAGTQYLDVYLNGTYQAQASIANYGIPDATSISLPAVTQQYNIDQTSMWNVALPSTEITRLYNSGSGLAYTSW